MIKVITGTMIVGLLFLQSPSAIRKSERERNGFVGTVKKSQEEWSPISGYPYPSDTRCRAQAQVYDEDGRLLQYTFFTGACGSDEDRQHYTYDQDGSRTIRFERVQGKNSPPPQPPP